MSEVSINKKQMNTTNPPTPVLYLDVRILSGMLNFASRDESRPILNGVCLSVSSAGCIAVATNGRIFAAYECGEVTGGGTEAVSVILPSTEIVRLTKLAKASKGYDLVLSINAERQDLNHISAKLGVIETPVRLIAGKYPEWRKVWPKSTSSGSVRVNVDASYLTCISAALSDISEAVFGPKNKEKTNRTEISMFQADVKSEVRFYSRPLPGFAGLLMPVKIEDEAAASADGGESGLMPAFVFKILEGGAA